MDAATSTSGSPMTTMGYGESLSINWVGLQTDVRLKDDIRFDTSGQLLLELALNRYISNYKISEMDSEGQFSPVQNDMTDEDKGYMYLAELFRRMDTLLSEFPDLLQSLNRVTLTRDEISSFKESWHDNLSKRGLTGVPVEEFLEYARFRRALQEEA
jgi:hypothetical protein